MSFVVKKNFPLDFLGEGWAAAYINFSLPSFKESMDQDNASQEEIEKDPKKFANEMLVQLESHFIDGKGWNGNELVDLEKGDIGNLPAIVFSKATQFVNGAVDPNS